MESKTHQEARVHFSYLRDHALVEDYLDGLLTELITLLVQGEPLWKKVYVKNKSVVITGPKGIGFLHNGIYSYLVIVNGTIVMLYPGNQITSFNTVNWVNGSVARKKETIRSIRGAINLFTKGVFECDF